MTPRVATRDELDEHWDELRGLDATAGTLEVIVARPAAGERATPATGELSLEDGLVGDRWRTSARKLEDGTVNYENQLTLASTRLLALLAEEERWPLAGDNLLVDMGLDVDSLPPGARLGLGDDAVIEISTEPHTGCAKFSARFGSDALKFVNSPEGRRLRLRGVNARVVAPGIVATGDAIRRL
jgi:hypothetical protein